jgi:DNA-binding transcriptional LysR family regulator
MERAAVAGRLRPRPAPALVRRRGHWSEVPPAEFILSEAEESASRNKRRVARGSRRSPCCLPGRRNIVHRKFLGMVECLKAGRYWGVLARTKDRREARSDVVARLTDSGPAGEGVNSGLCVEKQESVRALTRAARKAIMVRSDWIAPLALSRGNAGEGFKKSRRWFCPAMARRGVRDRGAGGGRGGLCATQTLIASRRSLGFASLTSG